MGLFTSLLVCLLWFISLVSIGDFGVFELWVCCGSYTFFWSLAFVFVGYLCWVCLCRLICFVFGLLICAWVAFVRFRDCICLRFCLCFIYLICCLWVVFVLCLLVVFGWFYLLHFGFVFYFDDVVGVGCLHWRCGLLLYCVCVLVWLLRLVTCYLVGD